MSGAPSDRSPALLQTSRLADLRRILDGWRRSGQRIAFVPTMGNLHDGHLSLLLRAQQCADRLVASIYVNPLQFGAGEDFTSYPRTPEDDRRLLGEAGCDLLFTPSSEEIYPLSEARAVRVEVPGLTEILCGVHRPGHFVGVATVVTKLLNMVAPDVAVFGEKDLQQLRVIERLVRDLHLPVRVVSAPTAREADGLAMSSRNRYLGEQERRRASTLFLTLDEAATTLAAGEADFAAVEGRAVRRLEEAGFRPDYVAVRRREDLAPPQGAHEPLVVLGAAWLGRARLIDNVAVPWPG